MAGSRFTGPIVVSLGDPAGVGPELIAEAWARRVAERLPPFYVAGGRNVLVAAAQRRGLDIAVGEIAIRDARLAFDEVLPVLRGIGDGEYRPGEPSEDGGRLALKSLTCAASHGDGLTAAALVTAPISKVELGKVGFAFPGQTEFVAAAHGVAADDAVMMLAGPSLRTVPLTVHCPISAVPGLLTEDLIVRRCRIVAAALRRDFGLATPRLAVCGLNPHAGEQGRMGLEDDQIVAPAIARLRAEGIDATGPHPADTLFAPHVRASYDVAIAMYHDQALIPLKTLDFDHGVNVTLGLPVIRTSPDHGTAFGIAGTRRARAEAMIAAIRMAGEVAARRASE